MAGIFEASLSCERLTVCTRNLSRHRASGGGSSLIACNRTEATRLKKALTLWLTRPHLAPQHLRQHRSCQSSDARSIYRRVIGWMGFVVLRHTVSELWFSPRALVIVNSIQVHLQESNPDLERDRIISGILQPKGLRDFVGEGTCSRSIVGKEDTL